MNVPSNNQAIRQFPHVLAQSELSSGKCPKYADSSQDEKIGLGRRGKMEKFSFADWQF
jgi:hypothetical protein